MNESTISKKTNIINIILICLIIVVPFLLVFQGVDLDDTGTHLYNAIHLFDAGKSGNIKTIYSSLITYLFYKAFGGFGLISTFFLNSILIIFTAFICYKTVKPVVGKTIALIGVFAAEITAMNFYHSISYNSYTIVVTALCAYFAYFGIAKEKKSFIFLAGLLTGLNMFFRLPNVCAVLMGLGLIYWAIVNKMKFKKFIGYTALYFVGFAVAVIFSLVLFKLFSTYTNLSISIFGSSTVASGGNSYSIINLIKEYILSSLITLKHWSISFVACVFLAFGIWYSKKDFKFSKTVVNVICLLGIIGSFIGFFIYVKSSTSYVGEIIFYLWLIALFTFCVCNRKNHKDHELALLCVIGFVYTLIPFAGSNTGIYNAKLGFGILLPTCIYALYKLYKQLDLTKFYKWLCRILALVCAIVFVYFMLINFISYFEAHNRLNVTYSINSEKMTGLHTNKFRADYANTAIDVLSELDNEYMLIYPGYDLLYYLTDKTSYLGRSGIFFDSYSPEQLEHDIYAVEDKPLPIIMISKIRQYWYVGFSMDKFFDPDKKQEIIEEFMDKNNYEEYYSDENITVYIPQ